MEVDLTRIEAAARNVTTAGDGYGDECAKNAYLALVGPATVLWLVQRARDAERWKREISAAIGRDGAAQNDGLRLALHIMERKHA